MSSNENKICLKGEIYMDSLQNDAKKRYKAKLQLIGAETCPYQVPEENWVDDPTKWPSLTYPDLYHYLIKTPRIFSLEAMENYKSLEAHKFFIDGWVQTVKHFMCQNNVYVLKADVRPSFRTTEKPHKPWIALNTSGSVLTGHCNCMAGLGETCSHVAAMLYKIEAAVRIGLTSVAPTDLPCKWNQNFTKNILGSPVAEINIYSDKAKAKLNNSVKKSSIEHPPFEDFENFLVSLNDAAPKAVGLSLFGEYQEQFKSTTAKKENVEVLTLLQPLRTLYREQNLTLSDGEYHVLAKNTIKELCSHSANEYVYIEEATRNQSQSFAWYEQRAGRITGSTIYTVAHGSIKNPSKSLVKKLCSDKQSFLNVPAINWGKLHENEALQLYRNMSMDPAFVSESITLSECFIHSNFEMQTIGLVISENTPWLAASPDACVFCSCCTYGVVEVKCPFSLQCKSLKDEIEGGQFYVTKNYDGTFSLKETHQYYYQVQLEMYCTDTTYCDFFVWTPAENVCIRVQRNDEFLNGVINTCTSYWKEIVLKELLLRGFEREDTKIIEKDIDIRTCHKCQSDKDDMMKCNTCNCWFHPRCVGRKTLDKSKTWNCKGCKKMK